MGDCVRWPPLRYYAALHIQCCYHRRCAVNKISWARLGSPAVPALMQTGVAAQQPLPAQQQQARRAPEGALTSQQLADAVQKLTALAAARSQSPGRTDTGPSGGHPTSSDSDPSDSDQHSCKPCEPQHHPGTDSAFAYAKGLTWRKLASARQLARKSGLVKVSGRLAPGLA